MKQLLNIYQTNEHFVATKGVHRNKSKGGGQKNFPTPRSSYNGGEQNLNCKLKTFGFLDSVHTVQLPNKYYFISPSNKTSRKKNRKLIFYVLYSSVSDFKSEIALSSRGGTPPPFTGLGGHASPFPLCTPLVATEL